MTSSFRHTHITLDELLNGCLWLIGLTLIITTCMNLIDHPWATLGLAMIIAGSLRTVTGRLRSLQERERDVFEMGRDWGARSIRRS